MRDQKNVHISFIGLSNIFVGGAIALPLSYPSAPRVCGSAISTNVVIKVYGS
jgi:hypothetical protein